MRVLLIFAVWCLLVNSALAEHEVDHRYNIRGYILDGNEQAIAGIEVLVFDGNNQLSNGKTDSAGFYSLHLHLHNEDNGRMLRIRAGSDETDLRVTFDPSDLNTLRVQEANFVGGKYIAGELGRFRMPPWIYALAGLFVIGFIAVILEKRRKRKIRLARIASGKRASSKSHKAKKRRHKKNR